jgi:para-nitrobenzyl esterase
MKKMLLSATSLLCMMAVAPCLVAGQQPSPGPGSGPGPGPDRSADHPPDTGHVKDLAIKGLVPASGATLTVTSPAFKDGADIPYENTQYRGNIFPGLSWTPGPTGTKSYAVFVQGQPEAGARGGTSIHLILYNIPASVNTLKPGMTDPPEGSIYGPNVHGANLAYAGPHTHTTAKNDYHYQVFAFDTTFPADKGVLAAPLMASMSGHVLASGDLIGVSSRDPNATDAQPQPGPNPIKISTGQLAGIRGRDPSVTVYRGIPYAAPPVGPLRFKPPQAPLAWQGVRTADQFGATCPGSMGGGNRTAPTTEDCLFANVWTKGPPTPARPVMVWYHGAGFAGSSIDFDGEALAKKGIVVVTFNRRDGILGSLATPELSKESPHGVSGNYTLQDSIAILQWVHNNIAAFGGDPANVTICGESAGAGLVNFLTLSPLAKGLFVRAIAQSHVRYQQDPMLGRLPTAYRTLAEAEASGTKFMQSRGIATLADLRAMPLQQILTGSAIDAGMSTILDGYVVPKGYHDAFIAHTENGGPVIAGNDRDETGAIPENSIAARRRPGGGQGGPGGGAGGPGGAGPSGAGPGGAGPGGAGPGGGGPGGAGRGPGGAGAGQNQGFNQSNLTLDSFTGNLNRNYAPFAADFLKLYPATTDDEAALENNEMVRDNSRISTYLWANTWQAASGQPVYNYFWTWRAASSPSGASHMSEIIYIFNNLDLITNRSFTEADHKVADTMSSYWANFMKTGNPNAPGLPNWPAADPKNPSVMELGEHFAPMPIATAEHLALWKKFFATQKVW